MSLPKLQFKDEKLYKVLPMDTIGIEEYTYFAVLAVMKRLRNDLLKEWKYKKYNQLFYFIKLSYQ